jgi:hypothetical protein
MRPAQSIRDAVPHNHNLTLETHPPPAYPSVMENPRPAPPSPAGWRESLTRSQAQISAGATVPLLPVLDRLRATAERIEAEQGVTEDGEGTPSRR